MSARAGSSSADAAAPAAAPAPAAAAANPLQQFSQLFQHAMVAKRTKGPAAGGAVGFAVSVSCPVRFWGGRRRACLVRGLRGLRLGRLGSPLRLDGVAPRVLSIGGLISIALAQGGLRFSRRLLAAAQGPLRSARDHLCAAIEIRAPQIALQNPYCQDILMFGSHAGCVLGFKRRPRARGYA